jgi:predicted aspartyl protease
MLRSLVALRASMVLGLAAANLPAQAASDCKLSQVADWPVLSTRGVPVVEGFVNGQKVGVLLDTGGATMMFRSATSRLGLTRQQARGYRVFGIGGESYVESTKIDEFKMGSLARKNWEVMVAGDRDLGRAVDLILGEDVFTKVDIEFDLPHKRVRLFQPKECEGLVLAYWAPQDARQVDLEPGPWIIIPVKINGQTMQALLDSGADVSVLDKLAAARLGLTQDSPGVTLSGTHGGIGAKSVDDWIAPLQSFVIGDEAISDTTIRFANLWKDATHTFGGSQVPRKFETMQAMLLGADFLRSHRVLVANSQRKMYFTYEGGPVFQPKAQAAPAPGRAGQGVAAPPPKPEAGADTDAQMPSKLR